MAWSEWLAGALSQDCSPLVQFVKYALVGGIATAVHVLTFFLSGFFLFPCVGKDDVLVRTLRLKAPEVEEEARARRAVYCNIVAFFASNTVCYILNRLFVFQPGAHSVWVEAALFYAVSAISVGLGTVLMGVLIKRFRFQTTWAFGANTVTSLLINYAARKFLIFNG